MMKKFLGYKNLTIFIFALIFGSLYSIYLLGSQINPTKIEWLFNENDPATYLIGWLYFRYDSWHWPLTFTNNLAYPTGASISYTDSIPLWAIIFKLFSNLLPSSFQYFGLFILVSFVLQFFWGAKLALLFVKNSLFCAVMAGILFMLAPPLTWRVHSHIALTSHWLILAAIWSFYQLKFSKKPKQILIFQAVIILIASGINPYIAVISLALILTSHCQLLILKKIRILTAIKLLIIYPLLLILGWYLLGYLSEDSSHGNSYGIYSLNLASIFNPDSYSLFLKPLPAKEGHYEGFNYLGIGLFLLILVNLTRVILVKTKQNIKEIIKIIQNNWLLLLLSLCFTLFALSNQIYWKNTQIFDYSLSPALESLFSKFRCSGRFFWPVHYLIILGVLVSTFKLWKHRQVKLLLIIIICLQFIDLLPLQASSKHWITHPRVDFVNVLNSQDWYQLKKKHTKLLIFPSYQCVVYPIQFPIFERLAVLQQLKTNSAYLARFSPDDIQTHCQKLPQLVSHGELEKDAAYVLDKRKYFNSYTKINNDLNHTHYCSEIDNYILCRRRKASEQGQINITASPYSINEIINFTNKKNNSLNYQYGDWSFNESNKTWTDGTDAHLFLHLQQPVQNNILFSAEVHPFLTEKHPQQVVDVLINQQLVTQWTFNTDERDWGTEKVPNFAKRDALIPAKLINQNSNLQITFRLLKPASPSTLNINDDWRLLGVAFRKLQLSENKS